MNRNVPTSSGLAGRRSANRMFRETARWSALGLCPHERRTLGFLALRTSRCNDPLLPRKLLAQYPAARQNDDKIEFVALPVPLTQPVFRSRCAIIRTGSLVPCEKYPRVFRQPGGYEGSARCREHDIAGGERDAAKTFALRVGRIARQYCAKLRPDFGTPYCSLDPSGNSPP